MENRKYTINGESNPKKCGMFDDFYNMGFSEYTGVNVLEDGTLRIDFLARHLSRPEVNNFHTKPLKSMACILEMIAMPFFFGEW